MGFKKPNTTVTNYVEKPGWFHCVVTAINPEPIHDGAIKDRVDIGIAVLGGTDPSQVKREMTIRLNNPNEGQKDGGEFCAKVQCRAAIALGAQAIITDASGQRVYCEVDKVPDDAEMELDWLGPDHRQEPDAHAPWVQGRQMVVKLHEEEYQGKKSIKLDGAHLYHVSDPDVRDVPKDAAALKIGGYKVESPNAPANPAPAKNGNGAAGAKSTAPAGKAGAAPAGGAMKPAPAKTSAAAGSFDNL